MEIIEDTTPKKFETILIIDTEGSKDEVREIGAILWNIQTNETVEFSSRLPHTDAKINELNELILQSDGIIGHSIGFDKLLLRKITIHIDDKISICSFRNFQWPKSESMKSFQLQDICQVYNIELKDRHMAIGDCRLLLQCFMHVPDNSIRLQNAFQQMMKRKKVISLVNSNTKLIELKEDHPIIAKFLQSHRGIQEFTFGEYQEELTISCPIKIEIENSQKITVENVQKLQFYINHEYPICVKRVRVNRHLYSLFVIGAKIVEPESSETKTLDISTIPLKKKNQKLRKRQWTTFELLHDEKIISYREGTPVLTEFKLCPNGDLSKCLKTKYNSPHSFVILDHIPKMIEFVDIPRNIENAKQLRAYILKHPSRVTRFQGRNSHFLIFTIGEPIIQFLDSIKIKSSFPFHIQNQTNCDDNIFLKYLEENKTILPLLQENKICFAPITLNEKYFILFWDANETTLKIVNDVEM